MTFLNPLALFALAAAAIPLVVHLFNFRKPRRVEFSSLVFLRELEKSTMQRVRIRQWLLLLLRTLAIACLVLAFSRPTLTGSMAGLAGSRAAVPIAIVVDNSLSMTTTERSGERFRIARDVALRIIEEAGGSDEIVIATTSDGVMGAQSMTRTSATDAVARMQVRPWSDPIGEVLAEAAEALRSTSLGSGEVFVVSDFQRSMLTPFPETDPPAGLSVTSVPVGSRVPGNIAVSNVSVAGTTILEAGQPARIEATITNYATSPLEELPVSLYLNDERVAQTLASTGPGTSTTVSLVFTPRSRGWHEGKVVIEDDAFVQDNTRYFTLNIPERRRILIVQGRPSSAHNLLLAMAPEVSESRIVFEREVIPASALSGQTLGSYDAVVLAGVSTFSSGETSLIANFVEDGGGLMIYPGQNADVGAYNNLLQRLGGGAVSDVVGTPGESSAIAEVGAADFEHPIFEGVFEDRTDSNMEQASVFAAMRYAGGSGREQTVLSLSNRWPLLQEVRSGAGVVLLMTSGLEPAWNELAVRGLFVPLVYRSLFYLSATETEMGDGLALSEDVEVRLSEREGEGSVIIATASGDEVIPEQRSVFGTRRVSVAGRTMGEPGFARILDGDSNQLRHMIAVNLDPSESDPHLISGSEVAATIESQLNVPTQVIDLQNGAADFARVLSEARRGVEIWNVFLLLALGFLVAEMLVAKRWKPEAMPA